MSGVLAAGGLMGGPRVTPIHPTDPFSASQLLAIEAALNHVWTTIRASTATASASEVELNAAMVSELHQVLADESVPGFTESVVHVVRGGEVSDATGTEPEKRPDITVVPSAKPSHSKEHWALFIECKVVDPVHPIGRYFSDGLSRFVECKYASAVRQGMMLAYTRGKYVLPKTLERKLKSDSTLAWLSPLIRPPESNGWRSTHQRSGRPEIVVLHLWLDAS